MLEFRNDAPWWSSLLADAQARFHSLTADANPATSTLLTVLALVTVLVLPGLLSFSREAPRPVSVAPRPQAESSWKPEKTLDPPSINKEGHKNVIVAYCPATGSHLGDIEADTEDTINDKVEKAVAAQSTWKASSWERRRRVLKTIRSWIVKDIDNIARTACRDTGKTVSACRDEERHAQTSSTNDRSHALRRRLMLYSERSSRPLPKSIGSSVIAKRYSKLGPDQTTFSWHIRSARCTTNQSA
jgi:hypothetical protein